MNPSLGGTLFQLHYEMSRLIVSIVETPDRTAEMYAERSLISAIEAVQQARNRLLAAGADRLAKPTRGRPKKAPG